MAGKYSANGIRGAPNKPTHAKMSTLQTPPYSRYPAQGKTYVACKKKNHVAGSSTCQGGSTIRALEVDDSRKPYSYETHSLSRVEVVEIGQIAGANVQKQN